MGTGRGNRKGGGQGAGAVKGNREIFPYFMHR